jgi:hypothetical protein
MHTVMFPPELADVILNAGVSGIPERSEKQYAMLVAIAEAIRKNDHYTATLLWASATDQLAPYNITSPSNWIKAVTFHVKSMLTFPKE